MNMLQSLSKQEVLKNTQALVAEERKISRQLIEYLKEIDRRELYAELGFSSLWDFCVQHLGLSQGATQRRISAMRLASDFPEVTESLETGKLSLSNAAQLQGFFNMENRAGKRFSTEEKKEIIHSVEGLSRRQCEQKLYEIAPSPATLPKERERPFSATQTELKVVLDTQVVDKLKLLRDRLGHHLPDASFAQIIEYLVDGALAQLSRVERVERVERPSRSTASAAL